MEKNYHSEPDIKREAGISADLPDIVRPQIRV